MKFLVAVHHRNGFDPTVDENDLIRHDIDLLNEEMIRAGVREFAGGLCSVEKAKALRAEPNGSISVTNGPYLTNSEHVDGFWILEVQNEDEALEWGRKAVRACRCGIDVRAFGGTSSD